MGSVTEPGTDKTEYHDVVEGETGSLEAGQVHGERVRAPADSNPSASNGVHVSSKARAATVTDPTAVDGVTNNESIAEGEPGAALAAKPAIEFSPAPAHIHRGASGGIFRGASGGIHRGASGGIGPHRGTSGGIGPHRGTSGGLNRGASGGIYRGRSGGIHLPSLASITFSMSRLPEEDAGVQMHLTKTEEVESPLDSPRASDDDAPPKKKKSRMRKHLTVVGACSFGFRLAETVLSLIAIVVMCSNSQSIAEFGTLRFNHFQAYRFLVAVNVCVFLYSTLQFIQLAYTVILGISFIPSILISTWLTFGFDQLFSYLLLSASTSAATVANMSYTGEMGVRLCSRYDVRSFCARSDAAVTMSFFTFLAMLSSTILAIYRIGVLLKEY